MTIFITRSHFLSIWNNMTKKQQINHEAIHKVRGLHLLLTKINELWSGRQEHFLYVWLLHYITLYQRSRKSYFVHNCIFRSTCICKQSISTKQCNYNIFVQVLYSYLRYTDRLLDVFLLFLAAFKIIRVLWEQRRKNSIIEKSI